jgi:hypothetical protein
MSMALLMLPGAFCVAEASATCTDDDITDAMTADDSGNPNGAWSFLEGSNLLPRVSAWQKLAGGWATDQAGWADSEDGNNRLPFWFLSNGSETFEHDYLAGDVVVHSTDSANGAGNGPAELDWTATAAGTVSVSGAVWMGREIGRSNQWTLLVDDSTLINGDIASGDAYSRNSPFYFSTGGGGGGSGNIVVEAGDRVRLKIESTNQYGDFVGVKLAVRFCAGPSTTTTTSSMTTSTTISHRNCGDPALVFHLDSPHDSLAAPITASDALYVLKTAVGLFDCEFCVCDVNNSGSVTASDALVVLKFAVGQDIALMCPLC